MTFVDESDLRLHALARRNKRSKSRDVSKEKTQEASPQRSTPTQTETKKVKKVVMVEDDESMVTASSPVRKEAVVQNSPPAEPARQSSTDAKKEDYINVNKRHMASFNKMKSSNTMRTLLHADEQDEKKRILAQQISKTEFDSKRGRAGKSEERSQSKERPSSHWRRGVTQTSLEREQQDSARKQVELSQKTLQYPTWWQGVEEIEAEKQAKTVQHRSDPAKAKVHKNMQRYAEDSLDARIRQVQQQNVPVQVMYAEVQSPMTEPRIIN